MKLLKESYLKYIMQTLLCVIAIIFILKISKFVLAPLLVAALISVALNPVLKWFQKKIKSQFWSVFILMVLFSTLICTICTVMIIQFQSFYEDFPNINEKLIHLLHKIENQMKDVLGIKRFSIVKITKDNGQELISSVSQTISSIFASISGFLSYLIFIPLYIFLILYYKNNLKDSCSKLLFALKIKAEATVNKTSTLIQDYLKGLFLVIIILGFCNSFGLLLLGVPYAFILGFIVALFGIIPYAGTFIGGLFVLFISYISQGSLATLMYIIILFSVIQFVEGNFLTPKIIGDKINLNPLIAILALVVGGQIWGVVGMILALPITSILLLISNHLKNAAFYDLEKSDNTL